MGSRALVRVYVDRVGRGRNGGARARGVVGVAVNERKKKARRRRAGATERSRSVPHPRPRPRPGPKKNKKEKKHTLLFRAPHPPLPPTSHGPTPHPPRPHLPSQDGWPGLAGPPIALSRLGKPGRDRAQPVRERESGWGMPERGGGGWSSERERRLRWRPVRVHALPWPGVVSKAVPALVGIVGQRPGWIRAGGGANARRRPPPIKKPKRGGARAPLSSRPALFLSPPANSRTRARASPLPLPPTRRSKAHVPLRTFDDPAQALAYFAKGPAAALPARKRALSLNGAWRFKLYDQPEAVPAGVWEEGFDDGDWADVSCCYCLIGRSAGAASKKS